MSQFTPIDYLTNDELVEVVKIRRDILSAITLKELEAYKKQVGLILERAIIRYNAGVKIR